MTRVIIILAFFIVRFLINKVLDMLYGCAYEGETCYGFMTMVIVLTFILLI